MSQIVTLGEIMLRLTPPNNQRFEQASSFDVIYGGDEANVASSLSIFGCDTAFITKVPDNPIGKAAVSSLRSNGVNTEHISTGGNRIGINLYEIGASLRPSKVIYDRNFSSISEAEISDFDFDKIFNNAKWFHTSGITPALSEKSAGLTEYALKKAKKYGLTVSMDLNYRAKLWTPKEAQKIMINLMQYVDVCIGNEEDTEKCLGFKPKGTDVYKGDLSIDGYKSIFQKMKKKFNFKYIAATLRESHSASDNGWSGIVYNGKEFYVSKKYDIHLIDRGGGGCAFAAGLIFGLINKKSLKEAIEFAIASSALKQTIYGDVNYSTVNEVNNILEGNVSGRIQR